MRARAAALAIIATGALALPAQARAPTRMLVIAQEWSLTLSRASVPAGAVTVQLYDRGQDAHNLTIRRLSAHQRLAGAAQSVALTQSGGLTEATWHLAPGRYELYCSLPGHAVKGMRAYLVVR
jgi:hypothetical protein